LEKIVSLRLTQKQKIILAELVGNKRNATKLVYYLSNKYCCSKSAFWNNLRELRKMGLVSLNGNCQPTKICTVIMPHQKVQK